MLHNTIEGEPVLPADVQHTDHGLSNEDARTLLRARAKMLAQRVDDAADAEEVIPVVEFQLGAEHYAIESRYICEVCPTNFLTPLPCTPPFIAGIMNVRGEIISVVDLAVLLSMPSVEDREHPHVILLRDGEMTFGILVDMVIGTRDLPGRQCIQTTSTMLQQGSRYLSGVTADGIVLLKAGELLGDESLLVRDHR